MSVSLIHIIFLTVLAGTTAELVTFFEEPQFKGVKVYTTGFTKYSGCHNLPSNWNNRAASVSTHGHCIDAFDYANCVGNGTRLAPGTAGHDFLSHINLHKKVSSFRSCHTEKPTTTTTIRPPKSRPVSPGQVTFYDDANFQGNNFVFHYKWSACYNIPNLWYHQANSVHSNSGCVNVYEGLNCRSWSSRVTSGRYVRQKIMSFESCER